LRLDAVRGLRWQDIDFEAALMSVTGKGGKVRAVPVADLLLVALKFHELSSKGGYVLAGGYGTDSYGETKLRELVNELCSKVFGIDPKTGKGKNYKAIHSFRHTFGTEMNKILPLFVVSPVMGHNDAKTTAIYGALKSGAAAQLALGKTRQLEPLQERLLELKDEGVNALGIVLFEQLPLSLQDRWVRRARLLSPVPRLGALG